MTDMPLHEGFPVAARSRRDIRDAAVHTRRVLAIPDGRINIPRLLDELGEFGIYYDIFDSHSSPVPTSVEACYYPEARTMYIRDKIYQEMVIGGQRAVFTFGHELGHAVLAHRRGAFNRLTAQVPLYCQSEWQANTFAAEFTMPLEEITRRCLKSPDRIAERFGVSLAAANIRHQDLVKRGELR